MKSQLRNQIQTRLTLFYSTTQITHKCNCLRNEIQNNHTFCGLLNLQLTTILDLEKVRLEQVIISKLFNGYELILIKSNFPILIIQKFLSDIINWTMTPRRDADIWYPYGHLEKLDHKSKSVSLPNLIT